MAAQCPFCGGTDVVESRVRGDRVCGNPACGEVLEEGAMVNDVSFVATGSGAFAAYGQTVNWSGHGNVAFGTRCSSELAVQRGVEKMSFVADRLQLPQELQKAGKRMYDLAVRLRFNAGRPTLMLGCACLYIVCRQNRSPHLLIDFSDVVRKPVKDLGRVYVKLVRRLVGGDPKVSSAAVAAVASGFGSVPIVDPSLFVERFALMLNLGEKQKRVQMTAMRIIQFMHRDWICLGRRPNGLCGAALLIAAYYNGIKCTAGDISKVVRISEGTLKVRLMEMQQTPLVLMNRAQFESADPAALPLGDSTSLPPCMRKRLRLEKKALEDTERSKPLMDVDDGKSLKEQSVVEFVAPLDDEDKKRRAQTELFTVREPGASELEDIARTISDQLRGDNSRLAASSSGSGEAPLDDAARAHLDIIMRSPLGPPSSVTPGRASEASQTEGTPDLSSIQGTSLKDSDLSDGEEDGLSDIDDEEMEKLYLLNEEETQHKSDMWHEVNKDYLKEWYERGKEKEQMSRARESASQRSDSGRSQTSSSRKGPKKRYSEASSPAESVAMALHKKGKVGPARINFDVLNSLFDD